MDRDRLEEAQNRGCVMDELGRGTLGGAGRAGMCKVRREEREGFGYLR
ncbi:hypothetical protein E2C01_088333 [Portunus trituberculatus]|uniref:Uncharacterized protein n=1 Tax=Portunus trituberculatus TaxID=210409 RepID=A0A5B7J8Y4_PORTR|nr:hypothetical protein [Portunus trituberculatus]